MGYVRSVTPLEGYRLLIELNTGSSITVDLSPKLKTARFAELTDQKIFQDVKTDSETVIWGSPASIDDGKSLRIDSDKSGTLTYDGVSVIVPHDTLKRDATFAIERLSDSEVEDIVPEGMILRLAGDIWEITTSGEREFGDNTITIKIPYQGDETPAIHWLDDDGNWVPLPTTVEVIDGRQYAVIQVNHLTIFAVFMEEQEVVQAQKVINLTIGEPEATVDGKPYFLDAVPVVGEGSRTFVPIRFVAEALGAEVKWDGAEKRVIIRDGDTEIILTVGSTMVSVNGEEVTLDCAVQVLPSSRTYVPLRFVSETLGAHVDYHSTTRQITITY